VTNAARCPSAANPTRLAEADSVREGDEAAVALEMSAEARATSERDSFTRLPYARGVRGMYVRRYEKIKVIEPAVSGYPKTSGAAARLV